VVEPFRAIIAVANALIPHFHVDAMKQSHCTDESQTQRITQQRTACERTACERTASLKIERRKRELPVRRDAVLLAALLVATAASAPVRAESRRVSVSQGKVSRGAPYNLPMGKVLPFQPPKRFTFQITEGEEFIKAVAENGVLTVTPQKVGRATLVIQAPNYAPVAYSIRVTEAAAKPPVKPLPAPAVAGASVTVTSSTTPTATMASVAAPTTTLHRAQNNAFNANARPHVPAVATAPNTTRLNTTPPVASPPVQWSKRLRFNRSSPRLLRLRRMLSRKRHLQNLHFLSCRQHRLYRICRLLRG
jgi:hypothetical protein